MVDLAIGGKAWIKDGFESCAILIEGDKIVDIVPRSEVPQRISFSDFGNRWILPGLVDIHVHLRDFEECKKEDFKSGTKAAVAGGFSTVLCMPNTVPPITNVRMLREAKSKAADGVWCDIGFHIGLAQSPSDLGDALDAGGFSAKLYPEDFSRIEKRQDWIETLASGDFQVYLHAEDLDMISRNRKLLDTKLKGASKHGGIRSPEAEIAAVSKAFHLLKGGRLHMAHVTTSEGIRALTGTRQVTFEVTVHHLALSGAAIDQHGGIAKVNPPLRSQRDVIALRMAVNKGAPLAIVSDHAPHLLEEKRNEMYDDIPSGFPGLETAFAVLCDLSGKGELIMDDVIKDLTSKPSLGFGLKGKGSIAIGMDADLAVVDPETRWKVRPSEFQSKAKFSPFEGKELRGRVLATMVGGKWAFGEGQPSETPNGEVIGRTWN